MKHLCLSCLLLLAMGSILAQHPAIYSALQALQLDEITHASQLDSFSLDIQKNTISCNGFANGAIHLEAKGGQPPYAWQWSNGAQTSALRGLTPGQYRLTVTDSRGASFSQSITLEDVSALAIDFIVSPDSLDSRKIEALVSGGTKPYQYQWNTGTGEKVLKGANGGIYTLVVTDENGCSSSRQIELREESPFSFTRDHSNLINIMPNPTQGIITIEYPDKFNYSSYVQLFDNSGQFLRQYPQILPLTKRMEIDLTGLSNGVYFVRIEWGGQSVIKKVVLVGN